MTENQDLKTNTPINPDPSKASSASPSELLETIKKLENSLADVQAKLKEEQEKALYQTMKAKEEEALSLKMEQALKEMQERNRTVRREQSLEEARLRAEEKSKQLEQQLNQERETWLRNLKEQLDKVQAENVNLNRKIGEQNKKLAEMEQELQEAKARILFETQSWIDKLDERILAEKTVRDTLHSREAELASLKNEIQAQESKMRLQYEKDKEVIIHDFEALLSGKESELASLKNELTAKDQKIWAEYQTSAVKQDVKQTHEYDKEIASLQQELSNMNERLTAVFEQERSRDMNQLKQELNQKVTQLEQKLQTEMPVFFEKVQMIFQKESGSKTETLSHEIMRLKDTMSEELNHLQNKMEVSNTQFLQRDSEIRQFIQVVKTMQTDVPAAQSHLDSQLKFLEEKIENQMQSFLNVLQKFKIEFYQQMNGEFEKDRSERSHVIERLEKNIADLKSSLKPSLIRRFWQYLDTPVIVLDFSGIFPSKKNQ